MHVWHSSNDSRPNDVHSDAARTRLASEQHSSGRVNLSGYELSVTRPAPGKPRSYSPYHFPPYAPAISAEVGAVHINLSSPMPPSSFISMQQPMSNVQNRKRPKQYDTTPDSPPAKRIKSTSVVRTASNFPPEFWDNLSKVWLTPRALREKDRRNGARHPATNFRANYSVATTLARFSRRGGPDLGHLRGVGPTATNQQDVY